MDRPRGLSSPSPPWRGGPAVPRGSPVPASPTPSLGSPAPGGGSSGGKAHPAGAGGGGGGGGSGSGGGCCEARPAWAWRPVLGGKVADRWRLRVGLLALLGVVLMLTTLFLGVDREGVGGWAPPPVSPHDSGLAEAVDETGGGSFRAAAAAAAAGRGCGGGRRPPPGEVDVAYFIQVSQSNLPLLPRLLRSLSHDGNVVAVHFDLKISDAVLSPVIESIRTDASLAAVRFMPREVVTYRGISMVLNVLSAMDFLLAADPGWCYFINLSAADYPLASQRTVRRLLATPGLADAGANFASVSSPQHWVDTVTEQRIGRLYVDTSLAFGGDNGTEVVSLQQPNPLYAAAEWTARKSEAWMLLHRDFVAYVVRSAAARRLLLAFALSIEASEHFFVTLLTNTARWRRSLISTHLRLVVWRHRGVKAVQHPYNVDDTEPDDASRYVFADTLSSSSALFARKFRVPDSALLDTLDRSVSGIAPPASAADAAGVASAAGRVRDGLARAMADSASRTAAWEERLAAAAAAGRLPDKEDRTPLDEARGGGGVAAPDGGGGGAPADLWATSTAPS